jgi:aspartyl-tRNA(Asn)/glutamyl-tRNA(Gln) amidotransferase subunit C
MATVEEVKKLAALSRISIDDSELEKFTSEFDAIVGYIGQLEKLDVSGVEKGATPPLHNVMREDDEPYAPGIFTEKLAEQFPRREGDSLVVKQIISND